MSALLEVRPGSMANKGGELMLRAVVAELGRDYRLATEPWIGPYVERARLGLYQKLWIKHLGPAASLPAALLPRMVRTRFGIVRERDVDGILDAAGFAYGDQFGAERTERAARATARWRAAKKPVILLPQAFGPFTAPRIQAAAKALVANADLVFARDRTSLAAIRSLGVPDDHVQLAPDFTNVVPPIWPASGDERDGSGQRVAYVVPNVRISEHLAPAAAESYVPFLAACLAALARRGIEGRVLVHGGAEDAAVAKEVIRAAGGGVASETDDDPQRLKGLLGRSCLVIGSRYHALASALSQGVPVAAIGWSHKYEALLEDYDAADALVALPAQPDAAEEVVARALDEPTRTEILGRIGAASARQLDATRDMWRTVRTLLEARLGRAAAPA